MTANAEAAASGSAMSSDTRSELVSETTEPLIAPKRAVVARAVKPALPRTTAGRIMHPMSATKVMPRAFNSGFTVRSKQ